ncbi:hypothetical protein [Reichenbachiella versicolor]|uniref:hypothetical protein n=1 Tax=Reichenbachiella versicolor TaxID=1821036 RepID=UPI000D6E4814|nr:hypothetical protein [Reichenbachiella versicolor]
MQRNFNLASDELLQYGMTVIGHLEANLIDFTTMDADLNDEKVNNLKSLIDTALREGGDDMNKAELGQRTEKLLSEMNISRQLFNQLRYWIVKTYPNSKAIQRQFGIGRYHKVTKSQAGMISFLFELSETISQYRTTLEASGTPSTLLDTITEQAEVLKSAQTDQETYKGQRSVETVERIKRLNSIYGILREFNAAAEFVYFDSPELREHYRTPTGGSSVEEEVDIEV